MLKEQSIRIFGGTCPPFHHLADVGGVGLALQWAVSVPSWAIPIVRGGLAGAIFDCRMGTPTWGTFFWGESSSVSSPGRRKSSFVPRLSWGRGLSLQPSPGEFGWSANKLLFVVRFCRIFRAASVVLCDSFVWLALQKSILLCDCFCFNDCFPSVVIMKILHVLLHVLSPESALVLLACLENIRHLNWTV